MSTNRAKFTQMKDGDAEDYAIIAKSNASDYDHLADKVLSHLKMLEDDYGGFIVDRLTHSLQCATRAYRDGKNDEYVVCALIHDIGDNLAPANHAELAATILEPFVSEENPFVEFTCHEIDILGAVIFPVKVFAADKVWVPLPVFVSVPAPENTPE